MNKNRYLMCLFALFFTVGAYSQEHVIHGKVTEGGTGVSYVSVVVKGTTLGTKTNLEGDYSISVPNSASMLVFSSLGYKTKELSINGNTSQLDVTMEQDALNLDEAVVTAIGISKEKKITGLCRARSIRQCTY